ncbi:hypothetical protein DBR21_00015, partial [Caulobacter sp. HMWF009]
MRDRDYRFDEDQTLRVIVLSEACGAWALLEPRRLEASGGRTGARPRSGLLILPDQPAARPTPAVTSFL